MVNNVLPDTHNCQQMDIVNLRSDQYTVCYNIFYKTNISDWMSVVSMNRTITLSYTEFLMLSHEMADISVLIAAFYYIYPHSLLYSVLFFFVIFKHFHCYKVSNMIQSCERVYRRWQYRVLNLNQSCSIGENKPDIHMMIRLICVHATKIIIIHVL